MNKFNITMGIVLLCLAAVIGYEDNSIWQSLFVGLVGLYSLYRGFRKP